MIDDKFRLRYKNVPAAISLQECAYDTVLHNHEEVEVLIIEEGNSEVRIGNNVYFASAGDLFVINPMEIHSVTIAPSALYRQKCICFDVSLISDASVSANILEEKTKFVNFYKNTAHETKVLRGYAVSMFDSLSCETEASLLEVSAYVSLMTAYMLKNGFVELREEKSERFCVAILKYIRDNFERDITSAIAAKELHFNHSYFCRRFRNGFGMSFSQYLNLFRVMRARRLIEANGKSVSDVAAECGFSNPIYFSRCFKKYVGTSPSVYKKSI